MSFLPWICVLFASPLSLNSRVLEVKLSILQTSLAGTVNRFCGNGWWLTHKNLMSAFRFRLLVISYASDFRMTDLFKQSNRSRPRSGWKFPPSSCEKYLFFGRSKIDLRRTSSNVYNQEFHFLMKHFALETR